MILTSKNNPLVKETAALKDKKARKELGLFLVEGRKMSLECQRSPFEIEHVFVSERYSGEIPNCSSVTTVSEDVFRTLSDEKTPQGILCRVKIPPRKVEKPQGKYLFLDGVADPGNVGTIIRTANAAGYDGVYLTKDCADPYSPKSVRASMSGIFFTPLYIGERAEILSALEGTPLLVADMSGENVFRFQAPEKFTLVIGNEANGISDAVRERATHTLRIPMRETQESLNAAISAGIIAYALQRDAF